MFDVSEHWINNHYRTSCDLCIYLTIDSYMHCTKSLSFISISLLRLSVTECPCQLLLALVLSCYAFCKSKMWFQVVNNSLIQNVQTWTSWGPLEHVHSAWEKLHVTQACHHSNIMQIEHPAQIPQIYYSSFFEAQHHVMHIFRKSEAQLQVFSNFI